MRARDHLIAKGIDSETVDKFLRYHHANPEIWSEFEKLALQLIASGKKRYGAKAIMEVIRFHRDIAQRGRFKVSNSFTAYYARVFGLKHPQHRRFFHEKRVSGLRTFREAA